jgi:adenylate cyclase class 1
VSAQSPPIVLDYDEGIDRKTLKRLTDRFLEVNRQRWLRARSALTYRQQAVLDLLPLVFHLNHPGLPGYSDNDCPCGIACYKPDEAALHAARRHARTFRHRPDRKRQPALEALFLMGSPGSLGHSVTSDLDVWLCHQPGLDAGQVRALERKASGLAEWAGSLGVELHVFVFSAEDWRAGRQSAEVAGENCGSAQHYLLLDEFYRTSVHLAGARPLWWLIPAADENRYREYADYLLQCRFIRAGDYVDFGPVSCVPVEEFLGAGVWQLYKGIETPWKSLLKLMLIECYARNREEPLLSARFKEAVFAGRTHPDELDPYLLLYRRLEAWLQVSGAEGRLDLVRQSLYLKAGLPLTRVSDTGNWRRAMLASLVEEWGWPLRRRLWLDNREQWRAEDVLALRRSVVGELTHSYRLLARLAREHGRAAAISERDMNLLGRKLYAAFQRKAGKVEQINPGLAPSLAEENLSFVQSPEPGGPGDATGWRMFRDMESAGRSGHQPPIRRAGGLMELVLWSYLNGLLTRGTRLNVRSADESVNPGDLSVLLDALRHYLPVPLPPAPGKPWPGRCGPWPACCLSMPEWTPRRHWRAWDGTGCLVTNGR